MKNHVGQIITLNVKNKPIQWLAIQQDSPSDDYIGFENTVTIIPVETLANMPMHHEDINDYANSTMHTEYLNDEFPKTLDEDIQKALREVRIPYRPGKGKDVKIAKGDEGLITKAFCLSMAELGWGIEPWQSDAEGVKFDYFLFGNSEDALAKRASAAYWWLRSQKGNVI